MKDTHNIILILVSSKWLILSFRVCPGGINSWLLVVHLSSGVLSFPHYLVAKLHLNHRKASPCVFNFSFFFIILLLPEFFMEAQHGGSSRILFILQLFFKISLEVMIRRAILKIKHGVQHMSCFEEFKHSSSCIPKCNSFYLLRWSYVILDNFTSCFMIRKLLRMRYLNPSFFSSFRRSFATHQSLHWSYLGFDFT